MIPYNHITGYTMGVFLCLGQSIHTVHHSEALPIDAFGSLHEIRDYVTKYGKIFLFLGEGCHRIKKKAEQIASLHFGEKKQFFT
jgi:acyl-CoA synthetase (AMP-forming)/AMP-acid ligase II